MNQQQFLKELEKRLQILSKEERDDILNEYRDSLQEKVKHGKTEAEAIKDFGSIDELTKEILSAYKINSDYLKQENETHTNSQQFGKEVDRLVKSAAIKLSDVTKNIVQDMKESNVNLTLETVFELLLKALIFLVLCAVLVIPFMVLRYIGLGILDILVFPLNYIIGILYQILIGGIYFVSCALLAVYFFKGYLSSAKNVSKEEDNFKGESNAPQSLQKGEKEEKEESCKKKQQIEKNVPANQQHKTTFSDVVHILIKILVVFVSIPLVCFNIALLISLAICIYLACRQMMIWSIVFLLFGLAIGSLHLQSCLFQAAFYHKRITFYHFLVSFLVIITGGLMLVDQFVDSNYYDTLPKNQFHQATIYYEETLTEPLSIQIGDASGKIITDSELPKDKVKIEVIYFDQFVTVEKDKLFVSCTSNQCLNLSIYTMKKEEHLTKPQRQLWKLMIEQFNNGKVYNYNLFFDANIKIYVNPESRDLVQLTV